MPPAISLCPSSLPIPPCHGSSSTALPIPQVSVPPHSGLHSLHLRPIPQPQGISWPQSHLTPPLAPLNAYFLSSCPLPPATPACVCHPPSACASQPACTQPLPRPAATAIPRRAFPLPSLPCWTPPSLPLSCLSLLTPTLFCCPHLHRASSSPPPPAPLPSLPQVSYCSCRPPPQPSRSGSSPPHGLQPSPPAPTPHLCTP